jgi:hypothetical protein
MLKSRLYHVVCAAVAMPLIVACGGTDSDTIDEVDPQVGGSPIESVDVSFADSHPSISSDGQRIVYVTGRESTPDVPVLKAYKSDWPTGGAPGAGARVTASDIGTERWAAVSPDGAWVAILAVAAGGQVDLYLQEYAGTKLVRVTENADVESRVSFSADSKLLTWLSRTPAGTPSAWVTTVGAAAAAAKAASAEGEQPVAAAFLPAAGGGYRLALALPNEANDRRSDWMTRDFTTPADAAGAAKTEWTKDHLVDLDVPVAAAGATAILTDRVIPTGGPDGAQASLVTGAAGDPPLGILAVAKPFFAAVDGGKPTTFTYVPGFDTLAASLTADGASAFFLMRNAYRCDAAAAVAYGTFVVTTGVDGTGPTKYFTPRVAGAEGGFDVLNDICVNARADGTAGALDTRLSELAVNAGATATTFRALYVTRFSMAFAGKDCSHRNGDTEVFALDVDGEKQTIQPVSAHSVELESLNGENPCSL